MGSIRQGIRDPILGGDGASGPTIYSGDGVIDGDRAVSAFQVSYIQNAYNAASVGAATESAGVVIAPTSASLAYSPLSGGFPTSTMGLSLAGSGALFNDSVLSTGIKYAADYSANFTARSLVDKAYVDSQSSGSFYSEDGSIDDMLRTVDIPLDRTVLYSAWDTIGEGTANTGGFVHIDASKTSIQHSTLNGAGLTTGIYDIELTTDGMKVTDTIDSKGLVYDADYSANFVARSIVDKEYVDDEVAGVDTLYTASGTIGSDRTIQAINTFLDIRSYNGVTVGASTKANVLRMSTTESYIGRGVNVGGVLLTESTLNFTDASTIFIDTQFQKGMQYAADYSSNFGARTLVDKGYVDSEIAAADTSIYANDGIVAGNRAIQIPSNRNVNFVAWNTSGLGSATAQGSFVIKANLVVFGCSVMAGGSPVSTEEIKFDANGITVTDSTFGEGMKYAADYSATFVTRSVVDKGYSDRGILGRSASAASFTSSGNPILAITDTSAARTVTIATSDIAEGNTFIIKDEDGNAATNNITIQTESVTILSAGDAGSGNTDFNTTTPHGYVVGQRIIQSGFTSNPTYNGIHIVTSIVDTDTYQVVLAFGTDEGGAARTLIDGSDAFTISTNYGSMEVYCTDTGVFSRGGSAVPGAGIIASRSSTTGILEGGSMSIVGAPSQTLSIGATIGQIVDHSDPVNPTCTGVSISSDPTYTIQATTDGVYLIAIDETSTVIEIDEAMRTTEDRHENVIIGAYIRSGGAAVRIIDEPFTVGYGITTALSDFLHDLIGPANQDGNVITANGTNLSIDTSAGTIFVPGSNFMTDPDKPHQRSIPADTIITHRHSYSGSSGELLLEDSGADFTVIDPDQVNIPQGTLSATSNNQFTVQVVFLAPTGIYNVAYGQEEFGNLAAAKTAIADGSLVFDEIDAFLDQVKVAYIVVKQGTTDLTVVANAEIITAAKFRLEPPA